MFGHFLGIVEALAEIDDDCLVLIEVDIECFEYLLSIFVAVAEIVDILRLFVEALAEIPDAFLVLFEFGIEFLGRVEGAVRFSP